MEKVLKNVERKVPDSIPGDSRKTIKMEKVFKNVEKTVSKSTPGDSRKTIKVEGFEGSKFSRDESWGDFGPQ